METLVQIIQVIIAAGIINVWLLRFSRKSVWRGGNSGSLKEEFAFYGLPSWFMMTIGFLKISLALILISGLWFSGLTNPAAVGIAALMLGAIAMHLKVKDPLKKSLPAFSLLILCLVLILF